MIHDLIVIGAGPTGIAIGAEARKAGLNVLLIDKGALTASLLAFPTFMNFFTTRDKLEIAGVPLTIPDEKPTRQQALVYYRAVAAQFELPLALHEEVLEARMIEGHFRVLTRRVGDGKEVERRARAVALATGYFNQPNKLNAPGADAQWVKQYYADPYRHFDEDVVIVGGGNSACEVALDLWRNRARSVTLVVRDAKLKDGVKYWVRPDIENRIAEKSIQAHFQSVPVAFKNQPRMVEIQKGAERLMLKADAAYTLIGFLPDANFERRCGINLDPATLVPVFDLETCESNVPGLYVAGTLQAGADTGRIFIENSREHAPKIVRHLKKKLSVIA